MALGESGDRVQRSVVALYPSGQALLDSVQYQRSTLNSTHTEVTYTFRFSPDVPGSPPDVIPAIDEVPSEGLEAFLRGASTVSVAEFEGYGFLFAEAGHVEARVLRNETEAPGGHMVLGVEAGGVSVQVGWDASEEEMRMAILATTRESLVTGRCRTAAPSLY